MKVTEAFVIREPRDVLWSFFEQVERVAACIPGVEAVEAVDDENLRVRVAQAIGPMSATLDLRMQVTEKVPGETMRFVATGRSVKGAAGNVRAANTVRLEDAGERATRVLLDADVALGGVMGSVGQKVVAKQARRITEAFAAALERELTGGKPEQPAAALLAPSLNGAAPGGRAAAPAPAPVPAVPSPPAPASDGEIVVRIPRGAASHSLAAALGGLVAAVGLLLGRRRRSGA